MLELTPEDIEKVLADYVVCSDLQEQDNRWEAPTEVLEDVEAVAEATGEVDFTLDCKWAVYPCDYTIPLMLVYL